jgi:hemerythrin
MGGKMALVEWKQEYSVGIVQIDEQHKKLAGLINIMHDSIKSGHGKEAIGDVLNELIAYTQYHFSTEEKYFDMYAYPDSEEHKE